MTFDEMKKRVDEFMETEDFRFEDPYKHDYLYEYPEADAWNDGSDIGCSSCPEDECTGHCMSCPYRSI